MTNELLLGHPIFLRKPGKVHLIISKPGKLPGGILFTDTACFLTMYIHSSWWLLYFSLYILAVLSVSFRNFFFNLCTIVKTIWGKNVNGDKYESRLHFQYYPDCPCQFIIWVVYLLSVPFFSFFSLSQS